MAIFALLRFGEGPHFNPVRINFLARFLKVPIDFLKKYMR